MLILLTNDDGILSPGLTLLEEALLDQAEVFIVAPDRERSGISHAVTLHSPLRANRLEPNRFSVDGTPTDCVNLAVKALMPTRPDLIVSGVNLGSNLGDDISYSGTVAGAMEGALSGIPSMAISFDGIDFDGLATKEVRSTLSSLIPLVRQHGLPADTFLNVNLPAKPAKGLMLTRQGRRRYRQNIIHKVDPRGRAYYWIGTDGLTSESAAGTDVWALDHRYVSITPLHLDLTNHQAMGPLRHWGPLSFFEEMN